MQLNEEIKSVAAMVTFRQLYDDGNRDIYQILSKFIGAILVTKSLYSFELTGISENLKSEYGFAIPDYVVKTSIKKLDYVKRENGSYRVDVNKFKEREFIDEYNNAINNNEQIIDELCEYVTERKGALSPQERELLIKDFCHFLLENSNGNSYSDLISAFILKKNEMNEDHQIRLIKEGAILYAGINFNSNVSDRSIWKEVINIYVENEILFHLAGYNGEVFKKIADDLIMLINEMNSKSKKKVIHLRYFNEVEKEIDDFFSKAQRIVKGDDIISVDNYAMNAIVEGCKTESDVLLKKYKFMNLIKNNGILKATEYEYYKDENQKYNLESQELAKAYNITEDKIRYIKHINYINILRRGVNQIDLKNSKHIVLTETGKILQISKELCGENLPFAINIFVLTNRLWYDLNKGFGAKDLPASFDILVKSQIVLSKLLTSKIGDQYELTKSEYQKNDMSKEDLIQAVITLREESKRPEEITALNVEDILDSINEKEITKYKNEKEILKSDLSQSKNEVTNLHLHLKRNAVEIEKKDKIISKMLKEKEIALESMEKSKEKADKKIEKITKKYVYIVIGLGVTVYFGSLVLACNFLGEKRMNILFAIMPYTFIPLFNYLISTICKKKFFPEFIIQKIEETIKLNLTKTIYQKDKVDTNKIQQLIDDIQEYKNI